ISCPQGKSLIQELGQNVFTAKVPVISMYDPESFGLLWPSLSLHKRVGDNSLYFVVQQKIDMELTTGPEDNITLKYHA
ncbi:hypothetical protein NAI36_12960, partial [Francisella tularensis subsp. holarctica]|nr:hypothetical protein [Francisella tularensis subsp. holarctica]